MLKNSQFAWWPIVGIVGTTFVLGCYLLVLSYFLADSSPMDVQQAEVQKDTFDDPPLLYDDTNVEPLEVPLSTDKAHANMRVIEEDEQQLRLNEDQRLAAIKDPYPTNFYVAPGPPPHVGKPVLEHPPSARQSYLVQDYPPRMKDAPRWQSQPSIPYSEGGPKYFGVVNSNRPVLSGRTHLNVPPSMTVSKLTSKPGAATSLPPPTSSILKSSNPLTIP